MMAVEDYDRPNVSDDFEDDDDDGPVTFKRSTTSKKNQLHSEVRKSASSHSHDGKSYRQTSEVPSSNGQSSGLQG